MRTMLVDLEELVQQSAGYEYGSSVNIGLEYKNVYDVYLIYLNIYC